MLDLIIVGGGPAGLAASVCAAQRRLGYLVLSRDLGGKCNYSTRLNEMEEHPDVTVHDLVTLYGSKLERMPHSYRLEVVTSLSHDNGVFRITTDKGAIDQARAILVATGSRNRRLNVPGEFEYLSRGLGYSARSYSHLFEGKRIFLAGDSDRVLNSTIEISNQSGSVVLILLRESRCSRDLLDHVRSLDGVDVITDGIIKEFRGGDYASEAVVSLPDGERTFSADGFFVERELQGDTGFLEGVLGFHGAGYVAVDGQSMTAIPGLFAAGDVTGCCCEQVLVALGQGAKAMLDVHRYLLRLNA